ncbi:MAG TPA: hypothetical protein VKT82_21130 [Ktedonobacterales bacterium]|nr:hypothetical protein [Ktedonobacterales bacterium]
MRQTPWNDVSSSRSMPVAAADQEIDAPADKAALVAEASRGTRLLTRRNALVALALFLVALAFMLSLESRLGLSVTGVSTEPYFNEQAESWLHGRWDVDIPITAPDIETINGKNYLYYPPFPALLLLPFVALFGVSASDILFTTLLSAANTSLLYLLFEQLRLNGWSKRAWSEHALVTVFCCFGTINLYLSLGGTVWFTAHIVCMTCTLLALLLALRGHYGWGAALLGCAFFARFSVALGFLLLLYLAWQDAGRQPLLGRFVSSLRIYRPDWVAVPWRRLLPVAMVMAAVAVLFAAHNALVFGSPLDTGYTALLQQRYPQVRDGVFNISYVPANFVNMFFNFPYVSFGDLFNRQLQIDLLNKGSGISVFVTTPLFLLLFWRNQRFSALRAALWLVIGLDVVAMLLFYNAGGYQFGVRYLYDVYPFAFLLLVLNDVRIDWRFAALGLFGVVINVLGALEFWTLFPLTGK